MITTPSPIAFKGVYQLSFPNNKTARNAEYAYSLHADDLKYDENKEIDFTIQGQDNILLYQSPHPQHSPTDKNNIRTVLMQLYGYVENQKAPFLVAVTEKLDSLFKNNALLLDFSQPLAEKSIPRSFGKKIFPGNTKIRQEKQVLTDLKKDYSPQDFKAMLKDGKISVAFAEEADNYHAMYTRLAFLTQIPQEYHSLIETEVFPTHKDGKHKTFGDVAREIAGTHPDIVNVSMGEDQNITDLFVRYLKNAKEVIHTGNVHHYLKDIASIFKDNKDALAPYEEDLAEKGIPTFVSSGNTPGTINLLTVFEGNKPGLQLNPVSGAMPRNQFADNSTVKFNLPKGFVQFKITANEKGEPVVQTAIGESSSVPLSMVKNANGNGDPYIRTHYLGMPYQEKLATPEEHAKRFNSHYEKDKLYYIDNLPENIQDTLRKKGITAELTDGESIRYMDILPSLTFGYNVDENDRICEIETSQIKGTSFAAPQIAAEAATEIIDTYH